MSYDDLVKRHKELYKYYNLDYDVARIKHKFTPLFVNTLRISEKDLIKQLSENKVKVEKVFDNALIANARFSLSTTIQYLSGYFYSQEFSSMMVARVLDFKNKLRILDMAASPGGKSINLAVHFPKAEIYALELMKSRLKALYGNINRMFLPNIKILQMDARKASSLGEFDVVILDAPCSGNFFNDKTWYSRRKVSDFINRQKLQKELIDAAHKVLKKKGILIYSTCSMEQEENEDVVAYALKKFKLVDIKDKIVLDNSYPGLDKDGKTRRFFLNDKFTPFFMAKLIKDE